MKIEPGHIAVVTGAGSGIGRALALQLSATGVHVSLCDVSERGLAETKALCLDGAPAGTRTHTFLADVSREADVLAFRDSVLAAHATTSVQLVFNNAGIGGGGSFVSDPQATWERTFNVCWGGVYNVTRAFIAAMIRAPQARLVNVSSVNGFWASLGPTTTHTAYSAAKFAVKGFTEALIVDLRLNAPHVGVSLVMPGHVGTSIVHNTLAEFGADLDADAKEAVIQRAEAFRGGGLTPVQAAEIILDGVRTGRWRILVGPDAHALDRAVRADPETAYDLDFFDRLARYAAEPSQPA